MSARQPLADIQFAKDQGASASPTGPAPSGLSPSGSQAEPLVPSADRFASFIRHTLAEHPEWLPEAVQGLFAGSVAALDKLNQRRAASDAACLAALALCDTKRLSPEARAGLLATITRPMHAPNLCELERKFAKLAIEAQRP